MQKYSSKKLALALGPMVMALALAMDVYVPAIPRLTKQFAVSDNIMLLTLNMFMLTAGIMQLIIGPLSDSFGRKRIAYTVIGLFSLGCILCAVSPSPYFLIFARIVQSVGCCGMMVVGFTIVRDCSKGRESAKVYSYLNGIISFSPMFAPFIGSYLDIYLGWQATFLALLLISLFALVSLRFYLPETLLVEKRVPLSLVRILGQYRTIISNSQFSLYNLATCFGLSYLYLFCALSPYLIIRDLNIPEHDYGFYFFYMGLSFFIGSALCGFVVERVGVYKTCLLGFAISLVGGLVMVSWFLLCGLTVSGFIYPMLLVGIGGTFCMGAGSGGMMDPFGDSIGAAAALGGTLRFLFASGVGLLVINDDVASTLPLGLPAIIFSLIGLVLYLKNRRTLLSL